MESDGASQWLTTVGQPPRSLLPQKCGSLTRTSLECCWFITAGGAGFLRAGALSRGKRPERENAASSARRRAWRRSYCRNLRRRQCGPIAPSRRRLLDCRSLRSWTRERLWRRSVDSRQPGQPWMRTGPATSPRTHPASAGMRDGWSGRREISRRLGTRSSWRGRCATTPLHADRREAALCPGATGPASVADLPPNSGACPSRRCYGAAS